MTTTNETNYRSNLHSPFPVGEKPEERLELIADSGSTKTDWCFVRDGEVVRQVFTSGFNPVLQTEEEICLALEKELLPTVREVASRLAGIYFYGAGCIPTKIPVMESALRKSLPAEGPVEVYSDMVGAARGLCGHEAGIACILGTGSNSCYYDGREVVSNVSPLGFILGDEGSGAVLGKLLVGDVLKNQLTPALQEKFLKQFDLTPADIIDRVYRKPFPNRFLASLSPFLAQNIGEPCIHDLVLGGFKAFLKRNVMQYPAHRETPVHFIGSVAYHYREVLAEAANECGIRLGTILQSPMQGLVDYHRASPLTPPQ